MHLNCLSKQLGILFLYNDMNICLYIELEFIKILKKFKYHAGSNFIKSNLEIQKIAYDSFRT